MTTRWIGGTVERWMQCGTIAAALLLRGPCAQGQEGAPKPPTEGHWKAVEARYVVDLPIVNVHVGNVDSFFVLDTGAPSCCIDREVAARAGLLVEDAPLAENELVARHVIKAATMTVGGETFTS